MSVPRHERSIAMATSALRCARPPSAACPARGPGRRAYLLSQVQQSSVVSPIAETTTTTSLPCFLVSTMRSATRRIDRRRPPRIQPYFCTTSATVSSACPSRG